MTISNYLTIAASTLLVTACATNNAQKNTEIAETDLIYVEKVDKLIGETLDLVYEVDASVLLETRPGSNKKKDAG